MSSPPIVIVPPASVNKAVTALYALESLGGGHRFATRLIATGPVAKIVVVDKKECCDCTRDRTECTLTVLNQALDSKDIPVERLHVDTQEEAEEAGRRFRRRFRRKKKQKKKRD